MKLKSHTLLALGGTMAASLALISCGPTSDSNKPAAPTAPTTSTPTAPAPSTPAPAAPKPETASAPAKPATPPPAPAAPKPATPAPAPAAGASGDPAALPPGVPEGDLVEVAPDYPKPMFIGTPVPTGKIANLEMTDPAVTEKRLKFKLPKDATNVAKGKKVTSSDSLPIIGTLDLVTDGDADGSDGCYVELAPGKQWVQIDLGEDYKIWKVLMWHFHKQQSVYFAVVVQISDDAEFKSGVTTVYNNDIENKDGFGAGSDKAYVETNHGRLVDAKGAKGRYVRLWSNGNSASEMNHYVEVQVWGSPNK